MSDFALVGDELKRLVKIAKKEPLPFAYCPGPSTPEDLFAIHRKKPPEMMAKDLRASGDGNKVAYGQVFVSGKTMDLTCDRLVPGIAKKLKKFLKLNKINLNIQVLDSDGTVLESDIEDLEGVEDLDDENGDDAETSETEGQEATTTDTPSPEDEQAKRALAERYRAVQPKVLAVTGPNAEKLQKVLSTGIGLLRSGDLERAGQAITALENAVGQSQPTGEKPQEPGQPPKSGDEEALRALAQRLQAVAPKLSGAPPEMTDRLKAALQAAVDAVKGRDLDRATALITALEGAVAQFSPELSKAAQEARAAIPLNVVALTRARLEWINFRRSLQSQLATLEKAIVAACQGVEGYEDAAKESGVLFDHISGLDARLEEVLEDLVETPDGPKRKAMKDKARALIDDYGAELDGEFFSDVENNGFAAVTVRGPAMGALRNIQAALN